MYSQAAAPLDVLAKYFSLETYPPGDTSAKLDALYALRYQVYCQECGFLCADDYPDGLERDDFESGSAQFAARNAGGDVVGTARLVLGAQCDTFPWESHCPAYEDFTPPPPAFAAEVSRLAVSKNYRRRAGDTLFGINEMELKEPSEAELHEDPFREQRVDAPLLVLGLYREMYRYSLQHNLRYWYAAMEKSLARVLALYGFNFEPIGLMQDYYGPVRPYLGDLRKIERQLEESNPELLSWFRHGP